MDSPDAEHRSRSPLPRLIPHSGHSPVQLHIGGEPKRRSWESTNSRSPPRHLPDRSFRDAPIALLPPEYNDNPFRRSTPSPIATLSHSPSLPVSSLEDLSVYDLLPDRSTPDRSVDSHSGYSDDNYLYHTALQSSPEFLTDGPGRSYSHAPLPDLEHRYPHDSQLDDGPLAYTSPVVVAHIPQSRGRDNPEPSHQFPGQMPFSVIYTDDASTKLSDRVHRRCFNCCTTNSSTWRRSVSSPGKVLCNKCGLHQRTMRA
ncbi:hypothetical protein K503DRAFT_775190 [Rhizopogon vinicolor AM-OR11-026]|uniref:GATA-type domain-containing protein n=1 Tax=Rhizopogon vinicolor AM-OR11-026 TaxID=1314800 RepID=A0A1B7MMK1_9AGAM|nr:hypothetical protein K503DRAFT_775190 [Rhizopogon vinicolor AM-OR11-026]